MLRRIAVILAAAAILSSGPLCAQAPDHVEKAPAGSSVAPAPRAAPPRARTEPAERAARDSIRPLGPQTELVEKASKDSIRSLGLQTEFPRRNDLVPIRFNLPPELLWVALACAAALILYSLRDELAKLFQRVEKGWEPPPAGAGEVMMSRDTDALAAADRLSREGNFVEAMHVLLLHSLSEIRRQLGEKFADSLTSREILRVARLTAAARAALRDIVAAVERTYFGAYPAAAADYAACRQNFETLQQALHGSAPA
jgi:hypothetical protein